MIHSWLTWVVPRGSYANEYQVCVPPGSRELSRVRLTQIPGCCPQYWSGAVTGVAWFIHAKQKTSQVCVTLDLAKRPAFFYQFGSKFLLDFFTLVCSTTGGTEHWIFGQVPSPPKLHPFPVFAEDFSRKGLSSWGTFQQRMLWIVQWSHCNSLEVWSPQISTMATYISLEAQAFQLDTWMGYFKRHAPHSAFTIMCGYDKHIYKLSILSSQAVAVNLRQWIGSALVEIMALCLFVAQPLSQPMLGYCQLDP